MKKATRVASRRIGLVDLFVFTTVRPPSMGLVVREKVDPENTGVIGALHEGRCLHEELATPGEDHQSGTEIITIRIDDSLPSLFDCVDFELGSLFEILGLFDIPAFVPSHGFSSKVVLILL